MTLRVTNLRCAACSRSDAERPELRYHAERGSDNRLATTEIHPVRIPYNTASPIKSHAHDTRRHSPANRKHAARPESIRFSKPRARCLPSKGWPACRSTTLRSAPIPPSSVYHFFASVPALLEALTADIHAAFRASLQAPIDHNQLTTWRDLSRIVELRMLAIYNADAAARQLILAQHGLTEINQADRQHDIELGHLMLEVFDRQFQLLALPDDVDVFALAMELGDRVYARSVQLHDEITPRMAEEGMRVFDAYLGLYLPVFLGKRR